MKKGFCSVIALLLSCLLLFTGCSESIEKLTEKIKEIKEAETKASIGLRPVPVGSGLKVTPSDRYPAGFNTKYPLEQGSWSTEKPLFDPMGSEDQYSYVSYDYSEGEIIYVNESYRRTKHRAGGEHWILELSDDASDAMLHIEKYIIDLGGKILSPPADEIVFTLEESSFVWWGKITQSETTISIELFKERLLKVDETITIDTAGLADQPTFFTSRHGGNRLQSLTVSITGAEHGDEVELYAQGGYNSGGYIRDVVYDNRLIAGYNESGIYILDDIPQEPGDTKWYIKVYNEAITVSITLNEIADLTPVKHGENMGAVLVKGIPYGSVTVPVKSVSNHTEFSIYHPDLLEDIEEVYGNQTSDGDTIFWLPTGYWNLNIFSDILNTTSYARPIPVSEGELTVVDMASNLNSIFSQTADIKEGTDEHGMTFLDVPKEQGDQVSLSFLLFDSLNKNPVLQNEDIKIQENGELVELISVEKLDIPPSVVLLLDSSGSMGDQMQPAVDAAKAFVQGLPDNSTIQVIDFDSTARQLAGSTKAEVISSLDSVTKGGSTALYDATIMGLDLLKAEQRPTLVIFTDGKNEPAAGGLNDKSIVMEAIRATKVPTYTIGFGKEHAPSAQPPKDEQGELTDETDEGTVKEGSDLIDFATVSEGKYYSALDQNALNNVFASIAARLGNSYTAVYKRPLQANISDVPVVTVVLDRSGSMNELIENQGEKMQIAKDMFRDFFMEIPDEIMTQFITFEDIWLDQVLTKDKAPILYALSDLEASGGTNILDSAQLGYDTLRGVPSSKRILVFLTDAAMEGSNNEVFAELLTKIKEADIKSLWLGLGMEEEGDEENFAWASQTAGGSYLLPNSAKELSDGLDKMLHEVNQQGSTDKTIITMNIKLPNENGKLQSYSGSTEHKLSPLKSSDKAMEAPQAIKITMEKLSVKYFTDMSNSGNEAADLEIEGFDQYGSEVSQLLYGGDSPSTDTRIISRIPLKAKDNNEGIEMSASEYYRINRLRGIDAPQGMEYIALNLQIKNLFTDREFQIPDITSHFYLSVNDAGSYPASIMSWLAETPLA
ncbi:MAG: VWA domain-containing protein, partial [Clostridiales bacterium]|nr:VWA domain-containing protein [Clostridiales bacterium]